MYRFLLALLLLLPATLGAQTQIALLKYDGGGDWYANPTSLTNLIAYCNTDAHMNLATDYAVVDVGSNQLFNYPFVHMTGHGNVVFSPQQRQNLRNYLLGGGFLHIDDNYGIKDFILPQMKLVFPELDFVELPFTHPIFHQRYHFPNGLPKIHEQTVGRTPTSTTTARPHGRKLSRWARTSSNTSSPTDPMATNCAPPPLPRPHFWHNRYAFVPPREEQILEKC